MCDPVSAAVIGTGLAIGKDVASFAGQQSQTNAYNAASGQNAINAGVAASRKYADEQSKTIADAKQTNQEGYAAVMKARQAKGTALASASTSGFDASSVSVNSILSGIENDEANSVYAVQDRHDNETTNYRSDTKAYEAEAQGRINSMPKKSGPSPLGLALAIGGDLMSGAKSSGKLG